MLPSVTFSVQFFLILVDKVPRAVHRCSLTVKLRDKRSYEFVVLSRWDTKCHLLAVHLAGDGRAAPALDIQVYAVLLERAVEAIRFSTKVRVDS